MSGSSTVAGTFFSFISSCAASQQPLARDGDHAVRRRQMLERAVDDLAHALDHRLVLPADALDAGVVDVLLHVAIDEVVVLAPRHQAHAAEPVVGVRQVLDLGLEAGDPVAVLQRLERPRLLLPAEVVGHGVGVIHRHVQACRRPGPRRSRSGVSVMNGNMKWAKR